MKLRTAIIALLPAATLSVAVAAALVFSAPTTSANAGATQPAAARTAMDPTEEAFRKSDPQLYAIARQYFPKTESGAIPKRLFRLTRDQLDITAKTLLPSYIKESIKDALPRDGLQTNYEYADLLSVNAANSRGYAKWAGDIAARVRADPKGVVGCAVKSASADCVNQAIEAFVVQAFRGDVTPEKLTRVKNFFAASVKAAGLNQATGDLVEVVLNSPDFIFRKEIDVDTYGRLAPAQLLQAVTYTLTDAPPEKLGLSSALAGRYLADGETAAATINAIAASPDAREKLLRFFFAWLEIREPHEFTISQKVFPEFDADLATAMRSDTENFLRAALKSEAPSLKDITRANIAYTSRKTASLQGAPANTAGPVSLDPARFLGIFSQPALIASHSGPTDNRPIKRGVFWVRKAMCMEMEPPPKELHAKLYEMQGATERIRIEQSTEQAACAGCHKIINPFAFFQESYDALGRWRAKDNGLPIDTSIIVNFLDEQPQETKSSVDAIKHFTGSQMFKQCFVRQLFRFYMGRTEEASDDAILRRMFLRFAESDTQDIVRAVRTLTSSDRIVKRQ